MMNKRTTKTAKIGQKLKRCSPGRTIQPPVDCENAERDAGEMKSTFFFKYESVMANFLNSNLIHIVPLVVAVSIVYGATRDERPMVILEQIIRTAIWISFFLGCILAVLLLLGAWL